MALLPMGRGSYPPQTYLQDYKRTYVEVWVVAWAQLNGTKLSPRDFYSAVANSVAAHLKRPGFLAGNSNHER